MNAKENTLEIMQVLLYPLVSEKGVYGIESQNKIVFSVHKKATKTDVRNAVEQLYNVKVKQVNVCNDMKGRKKAIITLKKEFKASDIATKLKIV